METEKKVIRSYRTTDTMWDKVKNLCAHEKVRRNNFNFTLSDFLDELVLEKERAVLANNEN